MSSLAGFDAALVNSDKIGIRKTIVDYVTICDSDTNLSDNVWNDGYEMVGLGVVR